jgi:hypothetical protein
VETITAYVKPYDVNRNIDRRLLAIVEADFSRKLVRENTSLFFGVASKNMSFSPVLPV